MIFTTPKQAAKNTWVDWIQLFLIGLIAPFFLFPSMKYVWIFLIVPVIWICRRMVKKEFFKRTVLDWAMAILIIPVLATCIIVQDLGFSLPKIAGFLYGLAFFYSVVALLGSEKLIKWGIVGFLGAGLMLSVIGILGMKWDREVFFSEIIYKIEKIIPKIHWNLPGAEEGFNSNAIGGTLILIIPLCLVLFFSHFNRKKENYFTSYRIFTLIFLFAFFFVMCSVLFFTESRGSWLALIISIWILLLSLKWKKWSLLLIILLVAFIFTLSPAKTKLIPHIFKKDIAKRTIFWQVGIDTIGQKPFFGVGMNRIRQIPTVEYEKSHVHNHLLHTAAELGIPGLIAYLAILIGAGYMCIQIWHKSNIGWIKLTALGLGCGQLAHFIFGMADSIPLGAKVGIFFWFSLGLITAMHNYMLKSKLINQAKIKKKTTLD